MQFLYPSLTWAFLLVSLPLLIHLINLLRHRRIRWAAMDFLLESYRRQRKWILLKQLLLLLLRMGAIAVLVAMLAHLVTQQQWWQLLTARTTHHYVLLDDSLSMSDQRLDGSAFDTAQQTITQLVQLAAQQPTPQRMTVIRYSRAGLAEGDPNRPDASPIDWLQRVIDLDADLQWEALRRRMHVTQLAEGPGEALRLAGQLIEQAPGERAMVYVLSDFRQRDWRQPTDTIDQLQNLSRRAQVQLVRCVDQSHANLAITQLRPASGTLAAGVPLFVAVAVTNFSQQPAEGIHVQIETMEYGPQAVEPTQVSRLPALTIDHLEPGQSVVRQAQVHFSTAGQHAVKASLPDDPLEADNHRWCIVDLPDRIPVLIVDGDPQQRQAFYLRTALAPGERAVTGIQPVVEGPAYLRNITQEELERFAAVYLLGPLTLPTDATRQLEAYLRRGGGVVFAVGDDSQVDVYRQLNEQAPELMPLKLLTAAQLAPDPRSRQPDLVVGNHPVFGVLASREGESNPFAGRIRIRQYFRIEPLPDEPADSPVEVVARLRNGAPLIVESRVGQGKLMIWLTTLGPSWNNWAQEPTYPVVILQQQSHVASTGSRGPDPLTTGDPVALSLDTRQYRPQVDVFPPGPGAQALRLSAGRAAGDPPSSVRNLVLGADERGRRTGDSDASGVYSIVRETLEGRQDVIRRAVNVPPAESALELAPRERLEEIVRPIQGQVHDASQITFDALADQGGRWSRVLMWVLIATLLVEQIVAYWASYHTRREVPL